MVAQTDDNIFYVIQFYLIHSYSYHSLQAIVILVVFNRVEMGQERNQLDVIPFTRIFGWVDASLSRNIILFSSPRFNLMWFFTMFLWIITFFVSYCFVTLTEYAGFKEIFILWVFFASLLLVTASFFCCFISLSLFTLTWGITSFVWNRYLTRASSSGVRSPYMIKRKSPPILKSNKIWIFKS